MPSEDADRDEAQHTAALMRTPLDRFTAARTDTARDLRKHGQTDLATRIAALRKPSLVLWTLNQAGAIAADDLDAVRSAGDRLRQAQEQLLGGSGSAAAALQRATQEQRRAIDTLTRRLGMVLTAAGHAASDDTLRRVSDGLRSASTADDETWTALREGHLLYEPTPPSFPNLDVALARRVSDERAGRDAETHQKRVTAAAAEVRRAEELERAAREQEDAARQRREQATQTLDAARAALKELERGGSDR